MIEENPRGLARLLLRAGQFVPAALLFAYSPRPQDLLRAGWILQAYYLLLPLFYVQLFSKFGLGAYLIDQSRNLKGQVYKGASLALSSFLLIVLYSTIILRHKALLPEYLEIEFGDGGRAAFLGLMLVNPILEETFWRLFLPKAISSLTWLDGMVSLVAYLCLHYVLFMPLLGMRRAVLLTGPFFSVGRSMLYIKGRYGLLAGIITHYGITCAGIWLLCCSTDLLGA